MAEQATPMSCKTIDIREGECVDVGGGVVMVELLHKTGRAARLQIRAPREVSVEKKTPENVRGKHAMIAP